MTSAALSDDRVWALSGFSAREMPEALIRATGAVERPEQALQLSMPLLRRLQRGDSSEQLVADDGTSARAIEEALRYEFNHQTL